jgi:hypothetical protein
MPIAMPASPIDQFFLARSFEHFVVAVIGAFIVWMGYRLFHEMPLRREGETKIALPGGISIFLSRVGPGVFFALFGTGLIGFTAARSVTYERGNGTERIAGFGERSAPPQNTMAGANVQQPRPEVVRTLAELASENEASGTIDQKQIRRTTALRVARQEVMLAAWDPNWGKEDDFRRWVDSGMPEPPPASVARAAQVFRGQ